MVHTSVYTHVHEERDRRIRQVNTNQIKRHGAKDPIRFCKQRTRGERMFIECGYGTLHREAKSGSGIFFFSELESFQLEKARKLEGK